MRANGRPSTDASGRASFGAVNATPTNSPSTPTASDSSRGPAATPPTNSP